MRNLISITDLSIGEIDEMITLAGDIMDNPLKYEKVCQGEILATLFFEPSTRTRLSFESAMLSLGEMSWDFQRRIQVLRLKEKVSAIP